MFFAGQNLTADLLNSTFRPQVSDTQNTSGTTTSTSHTATLTGAGATACACVFVAPASGSVEIVNTVEAFNSGASGYMNSSYEIREGASVGSGTIVVAAAFEHATQVTGTAPIRASVSQTWSGLTPGATYNVRQLFRVNSGTGTVSRKQLTVKSCI